ncbi:MAG: SDR family oxidoreductase [Planctomycetota bacterium]|nr:SDR family oxidoreductase [Planctomycetota bacterium]MEE2989871.1 SDR family oxidoreductase [Planctomycetota bacterium]
MSTFLVTGGAGFIGSHLVEALVREGGQVRVLDNLSSGRRENLAAVEDQVELISGDVQDVSACRKAIDGVEVVFHLAALASVPASIATPAKTHDACLTGTLQMLDAARHANVRRFIFASSSSLYGNRNDEVQTETDLPAPESPYAAAKLAGEQYCHAFHRSYGLETVCLRYFNVFGPRQDPASQYAAVIPAFITAVLAGELPVVFGDGEQTRDFTYVSNVVQANVLAATQAGASGGTFNIANGESTSLLELLDLLRELLDLSFDARHDPPRDGDVRHSRADIRQAQDLLGYRPTAGLSEGLAPTIEYYRGR